MKIKTFILTFLMMMSSPFLFGQQTGANYDWGDAPYSQNKAMMSAKLNLDGVTDYSIYEIGAFCGDEIRGKQRANSTGDFFLSIMLQESSEEISFRLYNHEADLEIFNVYETTTLSDGAHIGGPGNSVDVSATYVAKIGNAAYPTIEKAIAAAQEGETVTILAGNYTQTLNINKAITVQGERNDQNENLVNITGKLNITANNATAKNLNVDNGNGNGAYINAKDVTVDGCTVVGGNGFRNCYTTGLVTFMNSTITGSTYGIHFDGSAGGEIVIDNCVITGWTSFARTITKVSMKGTSFEEGNYNYVRFYQNEVVIEDCTFNENMAIDIAVDGNTTTIDDCTFTNGNIEDLFEDKDIVNSTIIVDGITLKREASIGNTYYETLAEAYTAATDGQTITLLDNITLSEKFVIAKSITLDGNGKILTYTGTDRAIDIYDESNDVEDVTIKNLTVAFSSTYSQRGINYNEGGNLTLDNVTVDGSSVVTYAVNLPSKSTGAKVTINESNITGKIALNVWGANAIINATDSHFTSVDNATHENYAVVKLNNNGTDSAEGAVITITGGSITAKDENGEPSFATTNATATGEINISVTTQVTGNIGTTVAIVIYEGASEFYGCSTLQDAIDKAGDDNRATVKLLRNVETSELIKVEKAVVIDLNGKTVTANCKKAFEVYANATIKNGKIWSQQRCVDTRKNVELTLADVTLEAPTYYSTHQNQQPLTVGGSVDGTEIVMTNVNINAGTTGYAIISFVQTNLTATNSNISGYSALYVKEGSEESEFNFVGSTLKGDIGSNDVEGNSFATIATEANNVTVTLDANSELEAVGQNQFAMVLRAGNNNITVAGAIAAINFLSDNVNNNTIKVKAEYADELLAEGYVTTEADANGLVQVSGLAVAKIGETYYKTLDEAFAAVQDGNEVEILVAGTYALNTSGKNIAITGAVDGVVFDNIGAKNMGGANVTFNNVTFNYATNSTYKGLQHSGNLTYNNCTINGQVFLYGESETFNNCKFSTTDSNNYNVWTYGAKEVDFNKCTFNSAGKSVLIYAEGASIFNNVDVTECTFNASAPVEGKAAIEMDSSMTAGINLTIDGETTVNNFGSGNVSNNSLWNNKKGNQGVNNDITVIVDNVVVLAPTTVAKIGETPYNTLQGAITAAGTTTTQIDVVGTTTEENITIADNADITLTFAENVTLNGYFKPFKGNLTINGGTINNTNSGASAIEITSGELNLNGVNIASARHAVRIDGAVTATINGGKYTLNATSGTRHAVNVSGAANVTIKAGTFVGPKGTTMDSGSAVCVQSGAKVTIEGGNYSGGKNNTLSADGNLIVKGGTFDQDPSAYVTTPYVVIKKSDNEYNVIKGVAKIGETYYESLTAAITAAQPGNTIELCVDITENVTVKKSLTINGNSKNYTGNISVGENTAAEVTVKNVNFIDGTGYAITTNRINTITVEDCTVANYGFGFLYANKSTPTVTVKNVTVENANYGLHWVYGTTATLENVTMTNVTNGLLIQNYASKTINLENCDITTINIWERDGYSGVQTFKFKGANTVGTLSTSQYAKYVLTAEDATLTAPEGSTVNVTEELQNQGYVVEYNEGVYSVVAGNVLNQTTGNKYATLQAAIDAASTGNTIVLLKDITENVTVGKNVTIDGAEKNYTGKMEMTNKADITVKNVNFDGKGYNDYAIESRGAYYITVEDCTAKNYGYGFIQLASGNVLTTIKDVTVSNMNYGIKVDYSNAVVLENLNLDCAVAAVLNSNYGEKTITIKNSNLSILGTWARNNTIKTTYVFEGANTVDQFIIEEELDNFKLADVNSTLTAPNEITVTTDVEGYKVDYADGKYFLRLPNYVAQIGETKYESLAAAISAASAGNNTIVLLADITEDVTVNKSLTIDGAQKNYTGGISAKGNANSTTVTVKNVNFVGNSNYAITTNSIKSITVENCTATNYSYGFLYANKSTPTVVVKNVTVDGGNYGFHWVYGTTATLENVTMTNVTNGLLIQNYASKTINLENCDITTINIWERDGYSGVQTFNFTGENTVASLTDSQYAKYVLAATDATLTAPQGNDNVESGVEGLKVYYADSKYYLGAPDYVAAIGEVQYESLQAAIDAAQDGDMIVVLKDITLGYEDAEQMCDGQFRSFINVDGKTITIDLNGYMVKAILGEELEVNYVHGMITTENEANLTIEDNSEEKTGTMWIDNAVEVYSLVFQYDGSSITINNGNYKLNVGGNGRGLIYSNDDEKVTVNGGKFILGNVGTLSNGSPWIFNASGQNTKNIIVNGGTFNDDILHQYYPFEVMAQKEKALKYDAVEELWTMEDAVAYVDEQHKSGNWYTNEVGFVTLEEAFAAAAKYNHNDTYVTTVTLLANVELSTYVTISKSVNLNLGQFNITRENGTALYFNGEGIEVTINGEGTVSGTQAVYVDNGTVTINGGNYVGGYEAVYVINNGHAVINGGTFGAENDEDDTDFVLNEYDATRDVTTIAVYGGTFHGFNPENNAAEGAGTNFCAQGHSAVETAAGSNIWEVMPVHTHDFYTGWRWYSTYIDINGSEGLIRLENALEDKGLSINHNVDGFVTYEDGMWWNELATLKETNVKKMYKIEVSDDLEMKLKGNVVDFNEAIEIKTGYNWIGYPFTKAVNLNEAFAETFEPAEGDYMISQFQFAFYYNGSWNGSLVSLNPGEGYIYERVGNDTELKYNVNNINRNVVKTNISTEDNKWTPNARMYPNNMTMIAVVDGAIGDNYEVAAFVNGEVRGSARPIYIEALDAYMMFLTIHGDEVEEMSFMYYDLTTGESYMLNDRFDYTNDAHLGSVKEPYVFSRGTTGIGDAAMSQVNIYPNPTTTGTEINLEAVCDTVEVFNALGVKVAEYQNVDSIDALETAGIYVIRITNDGNVQNCRLVVK